MASSAVDAGNDTRIYAQGFREGGGREPYVAILGVRNLKEVVLQLELNTEQANILGEEIRKQAEFAQQEPAREKGE